MSLMQEMMRDITDEALGIGKYLLRRNPKTDQAAEEFNQALKKLFPTVRGEAVLLERTDKLSGEVYDLAMGLASEHEGAGFERGAQFAAQLMLELLAAPEAVPRPQCGDYTPPKDWPKAIWLKGEDGEAEDETDE